MRRSRIRERRVRIDGRRIRCLEAGEGPPVVLVHGLGLSANRWRPHLAPLADAGYRVIAPDLPGFGRSRGGLLGQSVEETTEWLDRFSAELALPRCAWVGHSVSTQALLRLSAASPGRTAALVLAAPTGAGDGATRLLRQFTGLVRNVLRERPGLVMVVALEYLRDPVATLTTWVRARRHDPDTDAAAVTAPVLLVFGTRDPIVPVSFRARLEAQLRDVETARIPGAAHAVAIDPPGPFCDRVIDFLRRRYPSEVSTG